MSLPSSSDSSTPPNPQPPFYRRYWPFGVIFVFVPFGLLIGVALLITGDVYRKINGVYQPLKASETRTLIIVAIALQAVATFNAFQR